VLGERVLRCGHQVFGKPSKLVYLSGECEEITPINDFAMLVASNTNGINNYHAVENKYAKLINLQYS